MHQEIIEAERVQENVGQRKSLHKNLMCLQKLITTGLMKKQMFQVQLFFGCRKCLEQMWIIY